MDKTYVFDNADGGCSNNGMMGLLASLCNKQGLDPNAVFAMMNNRGNGAWGDMGAWWIVILLIFGWGGFGGFGGGFGGRGNAQGLADLGNLVNNDAGRELLMNAIQGNAAAIGQLSTKLGCDYNALSGAIQNLSTQLCNLGMGQKDVIFAIQNGNQSILSKLCDCCCGLRQQISDFRGDIALQMCQQTNALTNSINFVNSSVERGFAATNYAFADQTCQLKQAIADQTTLINDKFCQLEMREMQNKIDALRTENQNLKFAESQQAQNNYLVNQLRPCPSPSYIVPNPFGCGCNNYGYSYGNNGNCGNNCGGCGC